MGYLTRYKLKIKSYQDLEEAKIARKAIETYPFDGYANSFENMYNDWTDSFKWYDHEKELKQFSTLYPTTVFELQGNGEDQGDVWFKYFKAGKIQICQVVISFDVYDENKLQ